MEPVERFDPEGFRKRTWKGVETGDKSGALEVCADNGFWALTAPRFGLETERSERAWSRTDSQRFSMWKRRCRPGTLTSQWWRKRRCERAKGRIELPAPAGCQSDKGAWCRWLSAQALESNTWFVIAKECDSHVCTYVKVNFLHQKPFWIWVELFGTTAQIVWWW
jgi:hypothetical protein